MKFIVALFACVAIAVATDDVTSPIPIVSQASDINVDGTFQYGYETGNGIAANANGDAAGRIQGKYSYTSPDGTPVEITYTADENGYQATGAFVPQVPPEIVRSLEYIRAHPPPPAPPASGQTPLQKN